MTKRILLALLLVTGCSMSDEPRQMHDFGKVTDASGNHRLSLNYFGSKRDGYDFHSLVLEQKDGGVWKPRKEITQEAFEANHDKRRWVSQLHSVDPTTGSAIIQVAEGDAPKGSLRTNFIYTWRKWDLMNNKEIEILQECQCPFDPYKPKGS